MKFRAPNPNYNGKTAGVKFTKGIGDTSNKDVQEWLKAHGYIPESQPKTAAKKSNE